jgi:Cys-tRNA(Pro)/Cys-tRNA(Cys) deacylase
MRNPAPPHPQPPTTTPSTITPAIRAAERAGIPFQLLRYDHDPAAPSYGLEAAEALGVPPASVFKTLVVVTDAGRLAVALVPVDRSLDLKAAADALGVRRVAMAPTADAERSTGYVVGGISPLGQRRKLPTLVDARALTLPRIHVSAGRRGLEITLAPADLVHLCEATVADLSR